MGVCNFDTSSKEELKFLDNCVCTCQGETLLTHSDDQESSVRTKSPDSRCYMRMSHEKQLRKTVQMSSGHIGERHNEAPQAFGLTFTDSRKRLGKEKLYQSPQFVSQTPSMTLSAQFSKPQDVQLKGQITEEKLTVDLGTHEKAREEKESNEFTDAIALSVLDSAAYSSAKALHSYNTEYQRRRPINSNGQRSELQIQGRFTQQQMQFSPDNDRQNNQRQQEYTAYLNQPLNDDFSERTEWPPPSGLSNQMNDFEPTRVLEAQHLVPSSNASDLYINARPDIFAKKAVLYEIQASPLSSDESSDREARSSEGSQHKRKLEEPVVNELNRTGLLETQVSDGWQVPQK